ncbi:MULTISPECIES: N-methyl-L-tryptophan oxidase [unclassified Pseudomonas]|uniref:N-methyl-L-tryptophan oxidase n=1 Tax=unclassified Pseudomonas TaxID=196821 RepID=UPI001618DB22|nr:MULTISPECIES: N-methyl-L-tryptophan oxidase [unclassified Pseudomonas]MBB6290513.1 sarcosine oxidase [Pseudomonas sp. SJZ073]MBB6315760.1 sarcosine oxidase [Pseudomonas sp. JAI120]
MTDFDVIVLGAGTWGSAASWQLASRGHKVLALDEFHPPHMMGSHGGATRLARQSNSSGPAYIKLTESAWSLWAEISKAAAEDILVTTGSAFIGEPGSEWFDKTLSNLKLSTFEYEVLDQSESKSRFPWVKTRPNELTVWEPNGAIILVEPAIRSLQKLASEKGAKFNFNEKVIEWKSTENGVVVTTTAGVYRAKKLVITAGARSSKVLGTELPVDVERQVLVNFKVPKGHAALPALFFAAPAGDSALPAYGCPEPDGTYKFSFATRADIIDPDTISQKVSEGDFARVRDILSERLPQLDGEPASYAVCMWSESKDGHWILGNHPKEPNVVIGAGCTGRGFRYAPVIGKALADFVEGIPRDDLDTFAIGRIPFHASEK